MAKLPLLNIVKRPTRDWFSLFLFGDSHIGQVATNESKIEEAINYISKKDPRNAGVVLSGDLIENVLPGSKGSMFEMAYADPKEQIKVSTELISPVKKHLLGSVDGNHEYRTEKVGGLNPHENIAENLKVPYFGYRCLINLKLIKGRSKPINYLIYLEHGSGSIPKTIGGRYNKLSAIQNNAVADVYLKGHIHHKLAFSRRVWKIQDEKPVKRKIVFASNGSFLEDAEYAVRSGFEPSESGVARIELSTKNFNMHASI